MGRMGSMGLRRRFLVERAKKTLAAGLAEGGHNAVLVYLFSISSVWGLTKRRGHH